MRPTRFMVSAATSNDGCVVPNRADSRTSPGLQLSLLNSSCRSRGGNPHLAGGAVEVRPRYLRINIQSVHSFRRIAFEFHWLTALWTIGCFRCRAQIPLAENQFHELSQKSSPSLSHLFLYLIKSRLRVIPVPSVDAVPQVCGSVCELFPGLGGRQSCTRFLSRHRLPP